MKRNDKGQADISRGNRVMLGTFPNVSLQHGDVSPALKFAAGLNGGLIQFKWIDIGMNGKRVGKFQTQRCNRSSDRSSGVAMRSHGEGKHISPAMS
jgi:hypothetical protein